MYKFPDKVCPIKFFSLEYCTFLYFFVENGNHKRAQQQTEILATIGVRALSDLGSGDFLARKYHVVPERGCKHRRSHLHYNVIQYGCEAIRAKTTKQPEIAPHTC